ncbi:hypothetical protein ACNOYE_35195 [Nannocystaceae bacterium ST9]
MTERPTERPRSIAIALLIAALALPRVAQAGPAEGATVTAPAPAEPTKLDDASVRAALADGDLTLAREQAVALRKAEPTLEHFELEAEVQLALGDLASGKRALRAALERVPEADAAKRQELRERLEQLGERSRGVVEDEPASSHREQLDAERAERLAALNPPPPKVDPVDAPPAKRVPIVKKWYFWVTLTTIVGAAVAITAIAIDSNLDERDAARMPGQSPNPSAGGLLLRF